MPTATLYAACAYAAGLAVTLCLCAWLTPRSWWRRPTARTLGIGALGTWGCGSLILAALQGAHPALAASPAALALAPADATATARAAALASDVNAGQTFLVHRHLNLRATAGVDAPRLLTVPAGATVIATGRRVADWWQVTARVNGQQRTGWASSLWLRRSDDQAAQPLPSPPRDPLNKPAHEPAAQRAAR
jgi:hypothetical protein